MKRNLGRRRRKSVGARKRIKDSPVVKRTTSASKFYVYRITCGGKVYIGFTSRVPSIRLAEHIESARKGTKTKFYNKLRYHYDDYHFEVLSEFDDEFAALVYEIQQIAALESSLNTSAGGEGVTMKVIAEVIANGETVYRRM